MSPDSHPSFFDLDLWALGTRKPEIDAHVGSCAQCQSHLQRVASPLPLPPAVRERALDPWGRLKRRVRAGWLAGGLSVATAMAVVALVTRQPPDDGAKGSPSIALYVQHDAAVSLWDGAGPVRPGDRIELKIAPEGLNHVAVGSVDGGRLSWLYTGVVDPKGASMLPTSWLIDDAAGAERLTIVLSRRALATPELEADGRTQRRDQDVWTTQLVLPKQLPGKP